MAPSDNPLDPVVKGVQLVERRLLDVTRKLIVPMRPLWNTIKGFIDLLKKNIKQLTSAVGKAFITKAIDMVKRLESIWDRLKKTILEASKFVRKILSTIAKAKAPQLVFKAVKSWVARLAKLFRTVWAYINQILTYFTPITVVLSVIDSVKAALQIAFKWIANVTGALTATKKVLALVKKAMKEVRSGLKEVTILVKDASKLKPA